MARTPKRTSKEGIKTDVHGGVVQGVIGAQSVVIENLTFYSRAAEEPAQAAGAEPIGPCPYPGLAYFGPSDADLFFGRDAAIKRLAEAVGRQSFTALVGASGSGKSSVVLAGLAPRLHSDSGGNWRFSHFRIGTELESKSDPEIKPFRALARALVPFYVDSEDDTERLKNANKLATNLKSGELTLGDVFAQSRSRNKGKRILLIADQFEEAFTLVADDGVRNRFIDVLLAGFSDPVAGGVPDICLILTMRADFYGRALRHRPLADALQNHVENLGPMNREELQAAIVRPAENAGVVFEPGLVETLLDTVQSKPGGLPLLQFALREMWGRQERKKITRKSYDEIGGVEGALAQRAETVFAVQTKNGADPEMDKAFQRLFTRLVTLGEGQEDTRRVVERAELGDEVWGLAQRLAGEENRLVVTNASSARETAEVVHEALIRHWPKLVDWINRDRAFQSWLRQIGAGIELWSADPTDEGPLLRGGMLAQAREWLVRRRDDFSQKERDYIEASVALSRRVEAEKEDARRRQLTTKYLRALAAIGSTLAFIAIMFATVAYYAAMNAREALSITERVRLDLVVALDTAEQEKGAAERQRQLAEGQRQLAERLSAENATLVGMVQLFVTASIPPDREAQIEQAIEHLVRGKERYQNVGDKLNIPWYFIGIIHGYAEASFRFDRHIHNGDPLTARTVNVPRGRPPGDGPFTWEDSTLDFLSQRGFDASTDWSLSKTLLRFESVQGLGYRRRGVNSPYVWSCTNHYRKGLFVTERNFNPEAVANYCGAAAILKRLVERGLAKLD